MYTLYQTLYLLWHLEVSSWDMECKDVKSSSESKEASYE